MKHCPISILLLLSLLYLQICHCTQNTTQLSKEQRNLRPTQLIITRLKNFWAWIQEEAKSEDTFIGRCAGGLKKMRMAFNFIIFKLGIIVTALAFLSALAFKGFGIGIALLVMSAVGLSSKLFAAKHSGGGSHGHSGAVHLHIHNKGGGGGYYHDYHDHHEHDHRWYDRFDRLAPKNDLERNAIADLYRRLGIVGSYGSSTYGGDGTSIR